MKTIYLWSLCAVANISGLAAQNNTDTLRLGLEQCVEMLVEKNPNIRIAGQNVSMKESERKAAQGLYYPHLGVNANFGILSKSVELDLTPIGDALSGLYRLSAGQTQLLGALNPALASTPQYQQLLQGAAQGLDAVENGEWNKTLLEDNLGKIDAQFTWPIFTGGKIRAANRAGKAMHNEAQAKYSSVVNAEIASLTNVYRGLQLAIEVSKVRQQVAQAMKLHLSDAQKLAENGMISDIERLNASVALADAEREHRKSLNDVELLVVVLKNMLGAEAVVWPTDEMTVTADIKPVGEYVHEARQNNPLFEQIDLKQVMADQNVAKEVSKYMPDVAIKGSYDLYRYNMSDLTPDWYVGVGLRLNLFDGMAKTNKIQAAKIQREQINTYRFKAEQDIETGITQVYLSMVQLIDRSQTLEESLKLAEEFVRMREKSFAEGFSTSTQVVDANLNLARVKTEQIKTIYEFNVAKARLAELTGAMPISAKNTF